jgi:plasmid maintenance system antidote protein VapI
VPSSRRTTDNRRKMFLSLSSQIEGQLREAYDRQFQAGLATQSSLAKKLGVDRSAVHHRLMGHTNMTIETIADMVWALDHEIIVKIFDPTEVHGLNHIIQAPSSPPPNKTPSVSDPPSVLEELLMRPLASPVPPF